MRAPHEEAAGRLLRYLDDVEISRREDCRPALEYHADLSLVLEEYERRGWKGAVVTVPRRADCGCVSCICNSEDQCLGCGATSCKAYPECAMGAAARAALESELHRKAAAFDALLEAAKRLESDRVGWTTDDCAKIGGEDYAAFLEAVGNAEGAVEGQGA